MYPLVIDAHSVLAQVGPRHPVASCKLAADAALEPFSNHLIHDVDLQLTMCQQLLQACVFLLQRPLCPNLVDTHPSKSLPPVVEGRLGNPVHATQILYHLLTVVGFRQNRHDLLLGESALFIRLCTPSEPIHYLCLEQSWGACPLVIASLTFFVSF